MSDKHEVTLSPSAERDLAKLPELLSAEVRRFLDGPLRNDPRKAGTPLAGESQVGMFEATGRGWRVLYRVDANTRTVRVMIVGRRHTPSRLPF
ncbi:type II toxin-antitoxin system RelE/ParE family toxin [Frankia sp. Mgl5]|uniref:Cytotoxic translational repressor of toxin-antitoxin stability system n=1 Tax=Parafrankia soli TaxID=2599596 RepID=A0A1S1QU01_9ACTN|nr:MULTISPECIES: type II toxin-antitoxin system RelE/ParE family toxin [Frankiaceae]CAI7979839.1 mRNA interferase RelE/StbE [Frankia sp. Hr75.2]MCK9928751.1 type II toxin-antitoxin system RelE/ParE family toxin [Frankia sp. Mgl5]OHV36775.1 cytotoxic translational repressor of toxin-antitoxin stability system [Parafrankia soli]TCJ35691.1 type II toxin-antitoxin system RelE/ParE family toxin [Parafrankia sp. BMG5.11]SQD95601.1 Plasmid stabilization system [Parafrankia sp. Ea1.12]